MTTNINDNLKLPFEINIGFKKLLDFYTSNIENTSNLENERLKEIIGVFERFPVLKNGFSEIKYLATYKEEITVLLQDFFNPILSLNEIKMASTIFYNDLFCATQRFKNILKEAGEDYNLEIVNILGNDRYIVACAIILNRYYGYDVNFKRPFYFNIPNRKGIMKTYKILYNADFVEITKNSDAPEISKDDYKLLLDNFGNIKLWQEKFPINSYTFNGFVIANMFDVSNDQAISNIKATLIGSSTEDKEVFINDFQDIFKTLLDVDDLSVGFSLYNSKDNTLVKVYDSSIDSFLLQKKNSKKCHSIFCNYSFKTLVKDNKYYSVSNVEEFYSSKSGKQPQIEILYNQGIKSAIFAPIVDGDELLGVLELVSKKPFQLNSFKAYKLEDVLPYIKLAVKRTREEEQNLIQAIIQKECTAIHPSVQWKFEAAAHDYLIEKQYKGEKTIFKRIDFENVYPLFGQADIVNSSLNRNEATSKDLRLQLKLAEDVLSIITENLKLSRASKLKTQVVAYKNLLEESLKVSTEQEIIVFLQQDVEPFFLAKDKVNIEINKAILNYFSKLDKHFKVIYYYRKNFDDTVAAINEDVSSLIDKRQIDAQKDYEHFFERYKTDGVEHNMYIGEAITKAFSFEENHLHNLRFWQLQVMCESEILVNNNKDTYPLDLQIASMILVFSQPLTINFKFDEKHFDVDGTYNARYEVVKKRIDKSYIKGTEQRATQAGKITIMYSQDSDADEYVTYIKKLQNNHILNDDLEFLELETLQDVEGLKALRVSINYDVEIDSYQKI